MTIRESMSFYGAIFGCNLCSCLFLLPYLDFSDRPNIGGAIVGSLAMVIPFGIVSELLSVVRLSSLFEGSIGMQFVRGVATQLVSFIIGILTARLLSRFHDLESDSFLVPLVFLHVFGAIAIGNTIVRVVADRTQLS